MKTVCCAGAFDPFHFGHLQHLREAKKLGDWLVVILNSDADVIRKRGFVFQSFGERFEIIKELRCVNRVVPCIDNDGTVAKTLLWLKPDIFAKGGDRKPETLPSNEVEVCQKIGCQIVYGVGDTLGSSTELLRRVKGFRGKLFHRPSGNFK